MTSRGLRVLAVATRDAPGDLRIRSHVEAGLHLLGLVGLLDPPRDSARDAVRQCHKAGIVVHVVTGDNGRTAAEIARQVGIGSAGLHVVTGDELDRMSDRQLRDLLARRVETVSPAPHPRPSCASPTRCTSSTRSSR